MFTANTASMLLISVFQVTHLLWVILPELNRRNYWGDSLHSRPNCWRVLCVINITWAVLSKFCLSNSLNKTSLCLTPNLSQGFDLLKTSWMSLPQFVILNFMMNHNGTQPMVQKQIVDDTFGFPLFHMICVSPDIPLS